MTLNIIEGNITKIPFDAIVNITNTKLQMGSSVCDAIFTAAGVLELQAACDKLVPIKPGEAVITPGFDLPAAKHIIHAAGPIYQDGKQGEENLLRLAHINSLEIALKSGCQSVAFPLITRAINGYPKAEAHQVAKNAIRDFILEYDIDVFFVALKRTDMEISRDVLDVIEKYRLR